MEDQGRRYATAWVPHEVYQCGLAAFALGRHGTVTQLKGVVHECAFVLKHNTNPSAIIEKGWARLNPNPKDTVCDVLFTRAPGVQLKDTVSHSGATGTASRVPGYGNGVLGTLETVAAVERCGVRIGSSGISTSHNEGVAARAGSPGGVPWRAAVHNMKVGAVIGLTVGAILALVNGYHRQRRGEATWDEVLRDVIRDGVVGGASGGAAAFVGTVAAALVPPGWFALGASVIVSGLVGSATSGLTHTAWSGAPGAFASWFAGAETTEWQSPRY